MGHEAQDGPEGFTATDGRFVATPCLAELPDWPIDLDLFRSGATWAARHGAEHALARQFALIDGAVGAATMGLQWATGLVGSLGDPKKQHFTEEVLFEARRKRAADINRRVDALLKVLERPETCREFARRLSDVVGYPATQYANAYQIYMQAENLWAIELLAALPPARLAPALSGLVRPWLFDPHRTWFFEPALQRLLESADGDLRHLDGDVPVGERVEIDLGFDPMQVMSGEMSMGGMIGAANAMRARTRKMQAADDSRGRDVSEHLGVRVTNAEVDAMGEVGTDLLRRAREQKGFGRQPAGVFLAEALRNGLTPRADALPDRLWATYIAEHGHLLDQALGISKDASARTGHDPKHALALMRKLPSTPTRYKDALFSIALGKKKSGRAHAQRLLRGTPGLLGRLAKEGRKKGLDTRMQAAACFGFSGETAAIAIGTLEEMLRNERTRAGENAILSALDRLGADIATHGPDRAALIAEAKAVFDAPYPEAQRWLADVDLPPLTFAGGDIAPVTLGPWLMRLAAELGRPKGGPLLDLPLATLDRDSRKALGRAALEAFVTRDTLRWKDMVTTAYRPRLIARMYEDCVSFFDWETKYLRANDPGRHARRRERLDREAFGGQVTEKRIARFLKEKRNWEPYVHSAKDAPGILGLVRVLSPGAVKPMVRSYLGPHSRRSAQAKAVMTLYARFGGRAVVGELTRIAREQPQKGLRAHAVDLLEDLGVAFRPPGEPDGGAAVERGPFSK